MGEKNWGLDWRTSQRYWRNFEKKWKYKGCEGKTLRRRETVKESRSLIGVNGKTSKINGRGKQRMMVSGDGET